MTLQSEAVDRAHQLIKPYIVRTPVLRNQALDALTGAQLFFKCENLQRTGAFKFRGACHALLQLPEQARQAGVYTVSSGNHGAALACAGQLLSVPVKVAVPANAPAIKKANIQRYDADITQIEPGMQAREDIVQRWQNELPDARFIPPYNHQDIIAGQGTAALELFEQQADLDCLMAPVGGGGLLSGTILVGQGQDTPVHAAEPRTVDDAWASLHSGQLESARGVKSICDGLLTSLGDQTFPIIRDGVESIIRVTDQQVIEAMRLLWQELKVIVEPSSATVLAAVLSEPGLFRQRRIGLLISGGNVDITQLPWTCTQLELPQ